MPPISNDALGSLEKMNTDNSDVFRGIYSISILPPSERDVIPKINLRCGSTAGSSSEDDVDDEIINVTDDDDEVALPTSENDETCNQNEFCNKVSF